MFLLNLAQFDCTAPIRLVLLLSIAILSQPDETTSLS